MFCYLHTLGIRTLTRVLDYIVLQGPVFSVLIWCFDILRHKETWKGGQTVKKILNGGGSLSLELIKDTSIFFHKAKLISAYGRSLYDLIPMLTGSKFIDQF